MLAAILETLFPAACCACGQPGSAFCVVCADGEPAGIIFAPGDFPGLALGTYEGSRRRAVLAMKRGRRDVGMRLGELMAERLIDAVPTHTTLVPVPTTPARRRKRGFDQAELLAQTVSRCSGLPAVAALRHLAGDAQRGRARSARLAARGRFGCIDPSLVRGSRVVLVDDVATTGASLRDCAATLAAAKAWVVAAIVVARAK